MTDKSVQSLRRGSIKSITAALDGLDRAEITELLHEEQAAENPRESLIEALANHLLDLDAAEAPTAKAPDWMRLDYDGPITIDQAEWRNKNLKPWEARTTKPAKVTETK